jgi:hypothetical protein
MASGGSTDAESGLRTGTSLVHAVFDSLDEGHHVDRQHFHAKPFQQLALVDDGGPEEVDPLADVTDAEPPPQRVRRVRRAEEGLDPAPERRVIDAAVLDVGERHAQFTEHLGRREHAAQRVAQSCAVGKRRLVPRAPDQGRHAESTADRPHRAFGTEVAVRQEERVNSLGLEVRHHFVHVRLFADHTVRQDALQVDESHMPLAKPLLDALLLPDRILVTEHELADRAKSEQRPCSCLLHRVSPLFVRFLISRAGTPPITE